ncbi:MAG: zf-TFIIB domain-containing protein [Elusimicrobia bacterium]|nr:zf-TFIIB domain-containing protein [Elusimicrobiota bacterium]
MNCPKCIGKLSEVGIRLNTAYKAKILRGEGLTTTLTVDQCFSCNGVWFDAGELKKYLDEKITVLDSDKIPSDLMEQLNDKTGKCPRCNIDLEKTPAPLKSSIAIDKCGKCQGIWLDSFELDRLENENFTTIQKLFISIGSLFKKDA